MSFPPSLNHVTILPTSIKRKISKYLVGKPSGIKIWFFNADSAQGLGLIFSWFTFCFSLIIIIKKTTSKAQEKNSFSLEENIEKQEIKLLRVCRHKFMDP